MNLEPKFTIFSIKQVAVNETISRKDFLSLINKKYPAKNADKLFCKAFAVNTKITFDVSLVDLIEYLHLLMFLFV